MQYPYFSPLILTDNVFTQYGGQTGTSTVAQRQAAYLLAEEQMTEHLGSFLVPTVITGSSWYRGGSLFETEYGNIQRVLLFQATEILSAYPLQTQMHTGSVLVRNAEFGYLDIILPCNYGAIYSNQIVYESGFNSGTVTQPLLLAGLTAAAQIHLNEWDVSLANEGAYNVGVQGFSNQSYSEQRTKLGNTTFGNSALANRAAKLTNKYKAKPSSRFR